MEHGEYMLKPSNSFIQQIYSKCLPQKYSGIVTVEDTPSYLGLFSFLRGKKGIQRYLQVAQMEYEVGIKLIGTIIRE